MPWLRQLVAGLPKRPGFSPTSFCLGTSSACAGYSFGENDSFHFFMSHCILPLLCSS